MATQYTWNVYISFLIDDIVEWINKLDLCSTKLSQYGF